MILELTSNINEDCVTSLIHNSLLKLTISSFSNLPTPVSHTYHTIHMYHAFISVYYRKVQPALLTQFSRYICQVPKSAL